MTARKGAAKNEQFGWTGVVVITTVIVVVLVLGFTGYVMFGMPARSFKGMLPPLTDEQRRLRDELRADVQRLAGEIGERNLPRSPQLAAAANFIDGSFRMAGFSPRRETYVIDSVRCDNIEAELKGTAVPEIVVVGAHYDSVIGCPGANDNGSGVAALLALARRFAREHCDRTLRFVAFPNEEPLFFQTEQMGSWVYAGNCRSRGDNIVGMISLETIGYFTDRPGTQTFPLPGLGAIYPTVGNFISFVGNTSSRSLLRRALGSFRRHTDFPSEGAALPSAVPGVGWSDHWSFWKHGYKAIMVTDTAPFRYPHYHAPSDTPEKLEYDGMARVVNGLEAVIRELVTEAR